MSVPKTASSTDEFVTDPDPVTSAFAETPETPRPRLRQALTAGAARVRQSGGTVRRNPAPAAGALALAGGVIALLLVRRRAARARAARSRFAPLTQARDRWMPGRFRR